MTVLARIIPQLGDFIAMKGKHLAGHVMISIVDDDKSIREAAKTLVKSLGHCAATFASAEEFLQSGRLDETACVITDVQMPGMSGVELQNHLLATGSCTPVIFVTAFPEDALRERVLRAGAIGFLSKPFTEETLVACLERALALHRSRSPN